MFNVHIPNAKEESVCFNENCNGEEDIYKPAWFAFETIFKFLKSTGITLQTINTDLRTVFVSFILSF